MSDRSEARRRAAREEAAAEEAYWEEAQQRAEYQKWLAEQEEAAMHGTGHEGAVEHDAPGDVVSDQADGATQ
jgi:hypothetical protein